LVKRYVSEAGSEELRAAMDAGDWLTSRVAYVETTRAIALGSRSEDGAAAAFVSEWPSFDVVELTAAVAELAATLAADARLRPVEAIHLASAQIAATDDLVLATWNAQLRTAAAEHGHALLPERL